MKAVELSGASRVLVTHGFSDVVARLLRERGLAAEVLTTRFVGEAPPDDAASDDDAGEGEGDDADAPVTAEAASSRTTTTTPRAASG
jgi:putative mRNA 3-end processing factor